MIMLAFSFGRALLGSKPFLYAMGVLLAVGAWNLWIWQHDSKVSSRALFQVDTQARELSAKAEQAREAAYVPGSADRLKKRFCRDCAK